ncbi:MAG: hypothetical protein LC107_05245, partial [Chitinophagales bacterium]|nr:hypothetical protein [Chitinophagales bacterium]
FNFDGSKVEWLHTVQDTFNPGQAGHFLFKDLCSITTSPIEIDNTIIFNVRTSYKDRFSGTLIHAFDLTTGQQAWSRHFTPHYGYKNFELFEYMVANPDGNLIVKGSGRDGDGNPPKYKELLLDINTGNILNDKYRGNQVYTYYTRILDDVTALVYPAKLDIETDTLISHQWDQTKSLTFKGSSIFDFVSLLFRCDSPFTTDSITFTHLFQYRLNGKPEQWLFKTDKDANILSKKHMVNSIESLYYSAHQTGDLIELKLFTDDGNGELDLHQGYMYLDMDGNVIRKHPQMVIDGKKVRGLTTTRLKDSEDLLHVVRFLEDTDIYIYRETI